MGGYKALYVNISRLIFPGRVIGSDLEHPSVIADNKALALDINQLAYLIIIVQSGIADLNLDRSGVILNIKGAVDIARSVGRYDLSLDDDVLLDMDRLTLVHGLQCGDRSVGL